MPLSNAAIAQSQSGSRKAYTQSELKIIHDDANRAATNGGRCLNAIWYAKLPMPQMMILFFLGSEMDFNGTFLEFVSVSRATMAEYVRMTKKTLDTHLAELERLGYLSINRICDEFGVHQQSEYSLTPKLFDDYVETLVEMKMGRGINAKAASVKRIIKGASTKGREIISPGVGKELPHPRVNFTPLLTPSSPPSSPIQKGGHISKPNDDDVPTSLSETEPCQENASSSLEGDDSPSREKCDPDAIQFVMEYEWLIKKSPTGRYGYKVANQAAWDFLKRHDEEYRKDFEAWLETFGEPFKERLVVKRTMFTFLENQFEEFQRKQFWSDV